MDTSPLAIAADLESAGARPEQPPADLPEMLSIGAVCAFWGGDEPLNPATIYRQISTKQHPKPIKIGSKSRWLRSELMAELNRRVKQRDGEGA